MAPGGAYHGAEARVVTAGADPGTRLSDASELPPLGITANEEAGGSGADAPENRPPGLVLPKNYRWVRIDSALLTSKPPGASTARCVTLPSCAISA